MQTEQQRFHYKTRIRACGVLRRGDQLLCLNMHSPVTKQAVWTFPGGGVEVGESLHVAVQREFIEETGLTIEVGELLLLSIMIRYRPDEMKACKLDKNLIDILLLGLRIDVIETDRLLCNSLYIVCFMAKPMVI